MTAMLPPTRSPSVVNVPNLLTASRLLLGFVLFGLIAYHLWVASIAIFAIAAVTDWLDGYIARKQGLATALGRNFDPLVDKVVICGAYIFLIPVPESGVTAWMAVVVMVRELIITSLRSYLETASVSFGADNLGKLKMGLQCAALFAVFAAFLLEGDFYVIVRDSLIYAMLASTALSGMQYLWRAFSIYRSYL